MHYSNIALRQIDAEDRLYYLHHLNDSNLQWDGRQSLYNPVWLHEKRPSVFRIVDGFKVFQLAKRHSPHNKLPARVFSENSSLIRLWELRAQKRDLENNLSTMAYLQGLANIMEATLLTVYPDNTTPEFLPPKIGQRVFSLEMLQELISKSLHYEGFTDIHQLGYVEINLLNSKSESDLSALSTLFEQMRLKGKKLTSMLQLIDELNRGYNIQLSDILLNKELEAIRKNFPAHQRYRHIKSLLLTLRFPEYNKLQAKWDQLIKKANLEGIVDIEHGPYFEDDELKFIFSARNAIELKKKLIQLLDKPATSELDHLFDFI